ncbi:DnaA ATPase domain-containing protein [Telmatospirillum sp. J64-1]|uniref:HdaA/DnaA family protein n=1 Tax=Telmatospirillum sp. J64-1 TaxID=2502183 RepID=UPI00115E24C3|nr:DnaA/Hda family protein [Telmatospirillum sp. J64-1]
MIEPQLPLDLGHRPALGGADFLISSCNAEAAAWLDRWPHWPGPALVLHGPDGCGKTHLASIFAQRSGARMLDPAQLGAVDPFRLFETAAAAVVEDADLGVDEVGLFHLYNAAKECGAHLLLTGRLAPGLWQIALPDLRSRLLAAHSVRIRPPDDRMMEALLVKLFADRQLKVGQDVVAYLATRMERSFAAARALVAHVDSAALAAHRAVTVPFLRELLDREEDERQARLPWC